MFRTLVFTLSLFLLPWSTHAARPMLTDDARVVDKGFCQVESWTYQQTNRDERWALPACSGGAGREWALGGSRAYEESGSTGLWLMQYKQVVRELQPAGVGVAVSVGNQRVGARSAPYVNLPISWLTPDEQTLVHLNVGVARADQGTSPYRTWGLAVEHRVVGPVWLIAERYATTRERVLAQVGIRWWLLPDRLQVDATAGRQRQEAGAQGLVTLGLRWIFPTPNP